jgi:hypothetical protein
MPKKKQSGKNKVSIKISDISSDNISITGGNNIGHEISVRPEAENGELNPRLLGDSSTDAPPPKGKKKKKGEGK